MHQAEHHRHKHQRRHRGEHQPADHGPAQRRILLAALTQAQRHRQHADDHRQRRHQHRPKAHKTGIQRSRHAVAQLLQPLARKADHQHAVGRGHPHAHDRAGQRRHRQCGVRRKQDPDDAGQRRRQCRDDHKRVAPRLKVHHDQKVDQHDGAQQPEQQTRESPLHRAHLPQQHHAGAFGHLVCGLGHDAADVARHGAQVTVLRGRIDLHHGLDVVLADDRVAGAALEVNQTAHHLGRAACRAANRQIRQRRQRVKPVLGRLHHDRVRHAVGRIEPEGRRHLTAARQVDHQVIGHVARCQADLLGPRAVHVDFKHRALARLLYAHISHTWHPPNGLQQLMGVLEIGVQVVAPDLQVDRRRCAKVENLADDVGWREREHRVGKLPRQHLPQLTHVVGGRRVAFAQGNLDVTVLRADHAGVVVRQVDAAGRQADVVHQRRDLFRRDHAPDRALDGREPCRRLLHPRAHRHPRVDQDLATVHRGEKIAAQKRQQTERQQHKAHEAAHKQPAVAQRRLKQRNVAGTKPLEAGLKPALKPQQRVARGRQRRRIAVHVRVRCVRPQQKLGHGRHQRARQHERKAHRQHHRQRHRHKQVTRHALQEKHRHEHDADAEQGHKRRGHDLACAVHDGRFHILALFQVPVDVFYRHGRVVHQNAHRQRQAAQRHDVERLTQGCEPDQRAHDGQRNRHRNDHRRAPAAQKQQDHQARQSCGDQALHRHAGDRRAHEDRLVVDRQNGQRLGQPRLH